MDVDKMSKPPETPSTPRRNAKRPPPFTPKKAMDFSAVSDEETSPDDELSLSDLALVSGCHLIIRGIHSHARTDNPAAIVNKILQEIAESDDSETLDASHVIAFNPKPKFNPKPSDWTSSCYVQIADFLRPKDILKEEPRTDLLSLWQQAISSKRPEWEVAWAPNKVGMDKRMWVRFPDVKPGGSVESPDNVLDKLVKWCEKRNYHVCGSFVSKGGAVILLSSPLHVDEVIRMGAVTLPGSKQDRFKVVAGRQVEILNPFELAIIGLPDDLEMDYLIPRLRTFLQCNTCEPDGTPTLVDYRIPDNEQHMLVFHLTTWRATARALGSDMKREFEKEYGRNYPTMMAPASLFQINREMLFRKPTMRDELAKGKEVVNEHVGAMVRKMETLERTVNQLESNVQSQFLAVNSNLTNLTGAVQQVQQIAVQNQQASFILSRENQLNRSLSDLQIMKLQAKKEARRVDFDNEAQQNEAQEYLADILAEEDRIRKELAEVTHGFQALYGGNMVPGLAAVTHSQGSSNAITMGPAKPGGVEVDSEGKRKRRRTDDTDELNGREGGDGDDYRMGNLPPNLNFTASGSGVSASMHAPANSHFSSPSLR